jgi:alkaline phosphatase
VGIYGYDPVAAWADWMYMQNYATDSAAAATSMSCGEKAFKGAIGYSWDHMPLTHLFELAETMSMSTGTVTSVQLSHATPAAFRAHNESRNNYAEIAQEQWASGLDVVMGAGHPNYDGDGLWDPGDPTVPGDWKYIGGYDQWNDLVAGVGGWNLIDEKADFEALADGSLVLDRVAGVAQVSHTLQYNRSGMPPYNDPEPPYTVSFIPNVPSLETMTRGALNVLGTNPNGFALMVEGGAVDWAGHGRTLGRLIEEQNDFDASVQAVYDGSVDIGVSFDDARSTIADVSPDVGSKVIVFNITPDIANDVIAARAALPETLKEAFFTAINDYIQTEEGEAVMDNLYSWTAIARPDPTSLTAIADAIAQLGYSG